MAIHPSTFSNNDDEVVGEGVIVQTTFCRIFGRCFNFLDFKNHNLACWHWCYVHFFVWPDHVGNRSIMKVQYEIICIICCVGFPNTSKYSDTNRESNNSNAILTLTTQLAQTHKSRVQPPLLMAPILPTLLSGQQFEREFP